MKLISDGVNRARFIQAVDKKSCNFNVLMLLLIYINKMTFAMERHEIDYTFERKRARFARQERENLNRVRY